jgi:hypothetical protein
MKEQVPTGLSIIIIEGFYQNGEAQSDKNSSSNPGKPN